MIDYKEISVVIQGLLTSDRYKGDSWIKLSCKSVRKYLPGAEIIVSTWKGADVDDIDCDILVLNDDPGSLLSCYERSQKDKTVNNINRQIVSTEEGVKKASRRYVMKLRSDSYLRNSNFLKYYARYGEPVKNGGGRILTFEPRNPWGIFNGQFSLCDFWFFGKKEELLKLWDIPLYSPAGESERDLLGEEYIYKEYLKKHNKFLNEAMVKQFASYKEILTKYFVIIPTRKSGVKSFKYPSLNSFFIVNIKHYVLSHSEWFCLAYENGDRKTKAWIAAYIQRHSGRLFLMIKERVVWKKEKKYAQKKLV